MRRALTVTAGTVALPEWALRHAPRAAEPLRPLSPSDLGGAKALPGEGLPEDQAKRRGRLLHRLLEHLPMWPKDDWAAMGADLLASGSDAAVGAEADELQAEAEAILRAPDLAPLFSEGTLAEVGVTAELAGKRMFGIIDRLIVGPDRVLAVDFKSNATIPERPEEVPTGILRQMGAYSAALAQVYPGRRIDTAILWTRQARMMALPGPLIMAALQDAGLS